MVDAPERIRVAQDADGFWTCREAVSGSQEYVRADLYAALEAQLAARTGRVKPLDLSNLLRHAFFEGVMIAGGSQEVAAEWWPEYDPETCAAYSRILSVLEPASSEQAVTEPMVEAVVQAVRPYTMQTLFIDEHRELVRDALKAATEAGRHD